MAWAEKRDRTWRARYVRPDGRYGSESGFLTKAAALRFGREQEEAMGKGTWIDPELGYQPLAEYFAEWFPAQGMSESTRERYVCYYRNHIQPLLGAEGIGQITGLRVASFRAQLDSRVSRATAIAVMGLLRRMLSDAAFDRRITYCPVPAENRRGERKPSAPKVGRAVELETVLQVCARMPAADALLVLTTVFTGMRWGEAAGIRREYLNLVAAEDGAPAAGFYEVDEKNGALKELGGRLSFGAPKDRDGRLIELPPFLAHMLDAHVRTLPAGQALLFAREIGTGHSRSTFSRRRWRPACDGWPARPADDKHVGLEAAAPLAKGLRFHDLRHTHETWMTEDGIPKIARDARLGHTTPGMEGVYNHPTEAMRRQIQSGLTARWIRTLEASPGLFDPFRPLMPDA